MAAAALYCKRLILMGFHWSASGQDLQQGPCERRFL